MVMGLLLIEGVLGRLEVRDGYAALVGLVVLVVRKGAVCEFQTS